MAVHHVKAIIKGGEKRPALVDHLLYPQCQNPTGFLYERSSVVECNAYDIVIFLIDSKYLQFFDSLCLCLQCSSQAVFPFRQPWLVGTVGKGYVQYDLLISNGNSIFSAW
jgi:hypothetical protein